MTHLVSISLVDGFGGVFLIGAVVNGERVSNRAGSSEVSGT